MNEGDGNMTDEKQTTESPAPPIKKAKTSSIDFCLPKSGSKLSWDLNVRVIHGFPYRTM